jgi:hypothetical protein
MSNKAVQKIGADELVIPVISEKVKGNYSASAFGISNGQNRWQVIETKYDPVTKAVEDEFGKVIFSSPDKSDAIEQIKIKLGEQF